MGLLIGLGSPHRLAEPRSLHSELALPHHILIACLGDLWVLLGVELYCHLLPSPDLGNPHTALFAFEPTFTPGQVGSLWNTHTPLILFPRGLSDSIVVNLEKTPEGHRE